MPDWSWWNPIDQFKWLANKGNGALGGNAGGDDAKTYANVRGPDGKPVQVPTTYGQQLSQQTGLPAPVSVSDGTRQALLAQQGGLAGQFADQAQTGYNAYGAQGQANLDALRRQANGENSVSAEQLRQALGQQLAQQRSFAAGASPRNQAGAARTAAIQMGRASTAAAGQQSIAGLAERNQAQQAYGQQLLQLRGQDLNAALSSRQNAESGYGAGMTGAPQPTWIQQYGPAIAAAGSAVASDRRLKTDIAPGDDKANAAIDKLQPYAYRYKDPQAYGTGPQIGTTTQDLARAGLGQAVIKTPQGEMVDSGKLSGANTAMIAALGKRVAALEGGAGGRPDNTAAAKAFGADPAARAESMANWARTVGMDPEQVARDSRLQAQLARRVNDYRAASPQEKYGIAQIWGLSQRIDDEQRAARQARALPPQGAR